MRQSAVKIEATDCNSSRNNKIIEEEEDQRNKLNGTQISCNEPSDEKGIESGSQPIDQDISDLGSQLLKNRMRELDLLSQLKDKNNKKKYEVENQAIEYEEKAVEAEKYAQGLLQRSVAMRVKAGNLGKQSENLALQIKEVEDKLQLWSYNSTD